MEFIARLGALLLVVVLGTALRATGVLDARRTAVLTAAAFYVALPALVFSSTHDQSLETLYSPALVAGVATVVLATAAFAALVHRSVASPGRRSVAVVQSYHCNLGFVGLPLVASTLGGLAAAKGSIVLGAGALVQIPLTITLLTAINDAEADLWTELRGLATNPVLWSLAVGLATAALPVSAPVALADLTALVGDLALPVALLAIGASLELRVPGREVATTLRVAALKVVAMPALAVLVFGALPVESVARSAAVVMVGTPTAVSTYVYAAELGGDEEFASLNVFAITVVSLGTMFALLRVVG